MNYPKLRSRLLCKFIMSVIAVFLIIIAMYNFLYSYIVHADTLTGFLGVLLGGIITMLSNWYIQEYRDLKEKYEYLPRKIRVISSLRDHAEVIKTKVCNNSENIKKESNIALDLASRIDGKIYAETVRISGLLLKYNHKLTEKTIDRGWGPEFDTIAEEYIETKQEVIKELVLFTEKLIKLEESLTELYE